MSIMEVLVKIKEVLTKLVYLHKQLKLKRNEAMVRRICQEENLNQEQTDLICKVIQCESGFDDKAVCKNKNGTSDYGIIQANSYWYIDRMKLLTKDEALNNPEKSVRIMIQRYKAGQLKDWICYSFGYYKNYKGSI